MKTISALAVLAALLASGCRRSSEEPLHPPASGRPSWSVEEVTVVEGQVFTLTLTLSRVPVEDVEVDISADNDGECLYPDVVVFSAGDDTETVTITAVASDVEPERDPILTATTPGGSDTVKIRIHDDDAVLGPADGTVAFGTGMALLIGPGADTLPSTGDEELLVAGNLGAGTQTLVKGKVGLVSPGTLPVVAGADEVLVLGATGFTPTLFQLESISSGPSVTASVSITGTASRPVMIGARAVIVSRGIDGITSLDDSLIVVEGIGTATLTTKTVALPGLAALEPSIPVALDATSLLIVSAGLDNQFGTGDEALSVVAALDATPSVVPLFIGRIAGDASGQPIASGGTIAGVVHGGPDGVLGTPDDLLQIVRDVLAIPALAAPVPVGARLAGPEGRPLATGSDAALIPTAGPDGIGGNADDGVVHVSPLSIDPMVYVTLASPGPAPGAAGGLVLVSSTVAARAVKGLDGALGSSDDGFAVLSSLGTPAPAAISIVTGALANVVPAASSGSRVIAAGAGIDEVAGTSDDRTVRVNVIGAPSVVSAETGAFAPIGTPALVTTSSGSALAAMTAGADGSLGTADDMLSVTVAP